MKYNVIFMGTPQIAVASLQALLDNGFNVPLVLSQPDRPKGRGGKVQPAPVKELALAHHIEVYQPEKLRNNPEAVEKLKALKPDFFAVVAYGKILPKAILDIPKFAPINVHFSLLPLYRGAAPVNWAIMNGDEKSGVSTMKMDVGMDTGNILLMLETPIDRKNAVELSDELSITGAKLLVNTLLDYKAIPPLPQPNFGHSVAPMMGKELGLIDWKDTAVNIERKIRALVPWPTAYTFFNGKGVKIYAADVENNVNVQAGIVYSIGKNSFSVGTASGGLIIKELQLEGKRRMSAENFLAGNKISAGDPFGI